MLEARVGDPATAAVLLQQARARYQVSGDALLEVHALGHLAIASATLGEPRRAFALLDTALVLSRRHGVPAEEASALELLAYMYREAGDYERALDLYAAARRINRKLGQRIEEASDLQHEAEIYARLGDLDRARATAAEAAELHRAVGGTLEILGDRLLMAELQRLSGDGAGAERHLDQARDLAATHDGAVARFSLALSEARIADHAGDSRRVLQVLADLGSDLARGSHRAQSEAAALRARAHARLGDLEAARVAGYAAVSAVERVRERFGSPFLRTLVLADRQSAYTDLIHVLLRLGRVEEAFEFADASRGRAFAEHLGALPGAAGGEFGRALAEREALLRQMDELTAMRDELDALASADREPWTEERRAELGAKLERLRAEFEESLVRSAERDAGVGAFLGEGRTSATVVRESLRPGEVLLEFVTAPEWAIGFVVSPDGVESFGAAISAAGLLRKARLAHELASRPASRPPPTAVLEALHEELLGPLLGSAALAGARHLFVVPDAALGHLPFAALRDPDSGRFLVERYTLSYLPAAAALPLLRRDAGAVPPSAADGLEATVFAPLPQVLPATRREARSIQRALPGTRIREGRAATEGSLRRELGSPGVVHIASHGALEARNPFFSYVELSATSAGPSDDGRLEIHEIFRLSVRSPLVFLSGCETDLGARRPGRFAGGDDYATLSRAFLYAGAKNVVATLWRIEDEGAAFFAERFYEHLRTGSSVDALARAQRDLIASADFPSPYHWAAYRLSGEGGGVAQVTASPSRRATSGPGEGGAGLP